MLQMESDLTLENQRQRKVVQTQQGILKSSKENLDTVSESKAKGKAQKRVLLFAQPAIRQPIPRQPFVNTKVCRRCGKSSHPRQSCPAKDATCFRCNRKVHYGSQCLSKTVAEIVEPSQELPYSRKVWRGEIWQIWLMTSDSPTKAIQIFCSNCCLLAGSIHPPNFPLPKLCKSKFAKLYPAKLSYYTVTVTVISDGNLCSETVTSMQWIKRVKVYGQLKVLVEKDLVIFKVDVGANVTALSDM